MVAETFTFNHWSIQGCPSEECPGKTLYIKSENEILFKFFQSLNWKTQSCLCLQAMKERMNDLAQSLGMPPGLGEGFKWDKYYHFGACDKFQFCIHQHLARMLIYYYSEVLIFAYSIM